MVRGFLAMPISSSRAFDCTRHVPISSEVTRWMVGGSGEKNEDCFHS